MTTHLRIFIFSILTAFIFVPTSTAENKVTAPLNHHTIVLDIQNMTCPLCKYTIRKALQKVAGISQVSIDYDTKTTLIRFDPKKTESNMLIETITNAGYPAKIHTEKN